MNNTIHNEILHKHFFDIVYNSKSTIVKLPSPHIRKGDLILFEEYERDKVIFKRFTDRTVLVEVKDIILSDNNKLAVVKRIK